MKFKDIINRNAVNLTNCDQEPIHIPGSIQQFGFLLGVKTNTYIIDFCSGNVADFTGISYEQLLGRNIELLFGRQQGSEVVRYITSGNMACLAPLVLSLSDREFTCTAYLDKSTYVLEFEPVDGEKREATDIYQQTKQFTDYVQKTTTLQSLCQLVAEETRKIIDFDRVMVYRFDKDYNGEVIAESKVEAIEPFLGLHYPHTDIPAQARELFIKTFIRLIADVRYSPVPIYTVDDSSNQNLDLGLSALRSVSPMHIRYLTNMGVGATLTISLMHENKLWGLIACHHYAQKYVSMRTRIEAKLQGHFLSSQISIRQLAEEYEISKHVSGALDELLVHVFTADSVTLPHLVKQRSLLSLTNASGVILMLDDNIYVQGNVPPESGIRRIINLLFRRSSSSGFQTSNLSALYAEAVEWCETASGVIFHGMGPGNCIAWIRPEASQEVNWAGKPDKPVSVDGSGLTPRVSFELWREIKKCESCAWQKPELTGAANFANALQQQVNMLLQKKHLYKKIQTEELVAANNNLYFQKEEKEKLSRELSLANKELMLQNEEKDKKTAELQIANKSLEQLTYIASHDLQEPLRTISNYMQVFEEDYFKTLDDRAVGYLHSVNSATLRMSSLVKGLLNFSRLGHNKVLCRTNLKKLMTSVISDLSTIISTSQAVVEIGNMPELNVYEIEFGQLFQNLITNAIKFKTKDVSPHISVRSREQNGMWEFSVRDNGIGIEPVYFERIFEIFQRLHNSSEYEGTGIGLANCKKIVELHSGTIWIESAPGMGATVYFTIANLMQ